MADPAVELHARRGDRPRPVDVEPGERLGTVLGLLEQIDRVVNGITPVLRTVEQMTGLSLSQVGALMAFDANGSAATHPAAGQHVVDDLVRNGLARRTRPGGTSWVLTDQGRSALEQVQGLRIRIVDTVASTLGAAQLDAAVVSVGLIADAVERLPPG